MQLGGWLDINLGLQTHTHTHFFISLTDPPPPVLTQDPLFGRGEKALMQSICQHMGATYERV